MRVFLCLSNIVGFVWPCCGLNADNKKGASSAFFNKENVCALVER